MEGFLQQYLKLYRPLLNALNDLMSPYELSYSFWQVIFYIQKNGPSTLVEISNYYEVEKPTITRRVHRLEELQMIEQIPSSNRREKVIQLTPLGNEIYQTLRKKITQFEEAMMIGIPQDAQKITYETLPKIQENIMKKEGEKI